MRTTLWPGLGRGSTKEDLTLGVHMSKRGRKRKSRKKNGANHGNRPNA
jgi:hypothetical protein